MFISNLFLICSYFNIVFSVKNYDPFYSFLRIFAPYDGKD